MDHYKNTIVPAGLNTWHVLLESALSGLLMPGQNIAEFGCGNGSFAARMSSKHNVRITGFDISPGNVELARRAGVTAEELDFAATDWPIEPQSFDGAFTTEVIEHLVDPLHFLRGIRRTLRPGAFLCVTTPNAFNIRRRLSFLLGRHHDPHMDPTRSEFAEHLRAFSFEMIVRALAQSDFLVQAKWGDRSPNSQSWVADHCRSLLSSHICVVGRVPVPAKAG